MISFHKPILLGVMRIADEHDASQPVTKTHKGSRKVAPLWGTNPTRVPVKGNRSRKAMRGKGLGEGFQGSFGSKIGADMMVHQDRGALVDDIQSFHHMLALPVQISRNSGGVLKIQLPMLHRLRTL